MSYMSPPTVDILKAMLRAAQANKNAQSMTDLYRFLHAPSLNTYMPALKTFIGYFRGTSSPSAQDMDELLLRWRMAGGAPLAPTCAAGMTTLQQTLSKAIGLAPPAQKPALRQVQWGIERLMEELADCGRALEPSLHTVPDNIAAYAALSAVRKHAQESK